MSRARRGRRTAVLLVAGLAFAMWPGVVGPAAGATGGGSFCESAERFVTALSDLPNVDLENDAARRRFFRRVDRIVDALERQAPRRLRSAFRALRPVYDLIADDPDAVTLLVTEPKARRALNRLARYGERECDLELPTL